MFPKILPLYLAVSGLTAFGAVRVPVEDFARPPQFSQMTIAPDGQCLAALREVNGLKAPFFSGVSKIEWRGFDMGNSDLARHQREVISYEWLGPTRMFMKIGVDNFVDGTAAMTRDGVKWAPIGGHLNYGSGIRLNYEPLLAYEMVHNFENDRDLLMLDERDFDLEQRLYPHVVKVDAYDGSSTKVLANPGRVTTWIPDRKGVVRAGIKRENGNSTLIYRQDEKANWVTMEDLNCEDVIAYGFTADGKGLYLSKVHEDGNYAFFQYDIGAHALGEPLLKLPGYDVDYRGSHDDNVLEWSSAKQKYLFFQYVTDLPGVQWWDESLEQAMERINRRLPDTFNLPVSFTKDGKTFLFFAQSDRNPGAYYLYDFDTRRISPVARTMPWLDPEMMASMKPIKYTARDGLEIHGYLTLPNTIASTQLPLVVMPHGGPWVRDVWGFDPLIQMLANRGYAVLQMNYRGSTGYGHPFYMKGQKEVGGTIQQDIEDATKWAIDSKVADPKRIAIVGASYGGYSALYALGKSPGMYCCGISIAGVSDWTSIYKNLNDPGDKYAREYWMKMIGDPDADEAKLDAISPVNFAKDIVAPVLFIHGKDDRRVPLKQAKKMVAALEKVGRKPQSLFIDNERHGFRMEKSRIEEYKAIEAFLAKNLGPGAR